MTNPYHVALFLDFENLYQTLKGRSRQGKGDFGEAPKIDFEYLVASIRKRYGTLEMDDFIAAGNFTHYNPQLGGLKRLAHIIDVNSFLPRTTRKEQQTSPGKKHVIHNYADMVLAFEAGRHVETRPADIYLFIAGDAAFSAVGSAIRDRSGKIVEFILPDPEHAHVLKAQFTWQPFSDFQPPKGEASDQADAFMIEEIPAQHDPIEQMLQWVQELRRELHTAIPLELVKAMLVTSEPQRLIDRARSEMKVDIWENDAGVQCISLRAERLAGKVVKMETRPVVQQAAQVLSLIAALRAKLTQSIGRAEWRKEIKEQAGFTNAEAKYWMELLFESGMIKDGSYGRLALKVSDVICFVQTAETRLKGSP